jgi:hypothetical protein
VDPGKSSRTTFTSNMALLLLRVVYPASVHLEDLSRKKRSAIGTQRSASD